MTLDLYNFVSVRLTYSIILYHCQYIQMGKVITFVYALVMTAVAVGIAKQIALDFITTEESPQQQENSTEVIKTTIAPQGDFRFYLKNTHDYMYTLSKKLTHNTRGIWKVMHIHRYNFTQWSEKKDEGISVNVRIWGF